LNEYSKSVLKFQLDIHGINVLGESGVDRLISPTISFDDFKNPWSQIALSMAQESIDVHSELSQPPPLLVTFVIDEQAIKSKSGMEEFLDVATTLDVQGFYLLVKRTRARYQAEYEISTLSNLMYFVYVLAEVNGFEVVCGYTDFEGLLLKSVGASAIATGWFNSLRRFTFNRFKPRRGGGQAPAMYTSSPLLASITLNPTLQSAYDLDTLPLVLSGSSYDRDILEREPSEAVWPRPKAFMHHLEVLSTMLNTLGQQREVTDRLEWLDREIRKAIGLRTLLEGAGVLFGTITEPEVWLEALRNFRLDTNL
jgi:hypothetical protein